jgi:hypothetical protein
MGRLLSVRRGAERRAGAGRWGAGFAAGHDAIPSIFHRFLAARDAFRVVSI